MKKGIQFKERIAMIEKHEKLYDPISESYLEISLSMGRETIEASSIVGDIRVKRRYQGYSKRQAKEAFEQWLYSEFDYLKYKKGQQ